MKQQIVLYNPHVDDLLAEPPHFCLLRRRALKKYGFVIDALLNAQGFVPVIIDGTASSFIPARYFGLLPEFLRRIVSTSEYILWARINHFTKLRRISTSSPDLENHTLLAFSYKAASGNFMSRLPLLLRFRHVLFHLSHYFVSTSEKAENIRRLPNAWLVGDSDISDNDYFRSFFGWYGKVFLTLPFAVKSRFVNKMPLSLRESRCIATGSVHDLSQERPIKAYFDYMSRTGLDTYHPVRKEIYEARKKIRREIECLVSPYRNYHRSSRFQEWWQHFFVAQKNYFSVNIVEVYNRYKFAVIGEEEAGFPALGLLEAMACGCVVFGDPRRLHGLGLQAGLHYLPYDGTLNGLLEALRLAASRNDLEMISTAGEQVVRSRFSEQEVGRSWVKKIHSLS